MKRKNGREERFKRKQKQAINLYASAINRPSALAIEHMRRMPLYTAGGKA